MIVTLLLLMDEDLYGIGRAILRKLSLIFLELLNWTQITQFIGTIEVVAFETKETWSKVFLTLTVLQSLIVSTLSFSAIEDLCFEN